MAVEISKCNVLFKLWISQTLDKLEETFPLLVHKSLYDGRHMKYKVHAFSKRPQIMQKLKKFYVYIYINTYLYECQPV